MCFIKEYNLGCKLRRFAGIANLRNTIYSVFILIFLDVSSLAAVLGTVMVKIPFLKTASIFDSSIFLGRRTERLNEPEDISLT